MKYITRLSVVVWLGFLVSCGNSPTAERFVGSWFGGSGEHPIHFYRLNIQHDETGVVPNVRDIDTLRNPKNALDRVMNTLEHYAVQGANVSGAIPMSLEWAAPDQKKVEPVYVAYFLPKENMVVGNGLTPIYYHEQSDTLRLAVWMPCFSRSMELANSDGC